MLALTVQEIQSLALHYCLMHNSLKYIWMRFNRLTAYRHWLRYWTYSTLFLYRNLI